MTRRRRAVLLVGLALVLGTLAASDVAGREAALRRSIGPTVPVLVARVDLRPGDELNARRLVVRRVPARYAPQGSYASLRAVVGMHAAVAVAAGTDIVAAVIGDATLAAGAPVRAGERIAEVVAQGSPELVRPGSRVDVLVTRERGDGRGETTLALEDAEVLDARRAPVSGAAEVPRVAVSLRVTPRQAVYLAAAQSFARELRVLPRAATDRRHGLTGTTVGSDLR